MRQTLLALSMIMLGGAGAAANPALEAGEFTLTLSGGGTYLRLPEIRSTFYLPGPGGARTDGFYDDRGWGAGGSAEIAGGLGDLFAVGQPIGISLVARYAGFSQDDTAEVNGLLNGVNPEGSAALGAIGSGVVSSEQKAGLWEFTLTLNAPLALGEGWLLRPSIGPSLLHLSRSFEDSATVGGFFLGSNQEDLTSSYAGGVIGLDLEADFGAGWSASLGLLGGVYATHHAYDAAAGSGFVGSGGLAQQKDGWAWRGRASLELRYDLGWVDLGLAGGFDYISEAPTLDAFDFLDVVLGSVGPPLRADDDLWGASAQLTGRVRF